VTAQAAKKWRRSPRVLWRRFESGLVVLPPDAEECLTVSGSSWPVWCHLANPMSEADLCEAVSAEVGVEASSIAGDITALVETLAANRLIQAGDD